MALATAIWSGGFEDAPTLLVIGCGAAGILLVALMAPDDLPGLLRSPPVGALLGLSLWGVAALGWSEVGWRDGLLTALLPAAYAGFAAMSYAASARGQSSLLAAGLAGVAIVVGLTGLVGLAFGVEDWTVLLGGREVPAGTLEYPPALALLQLGALPILAVWVFGRGRFRAVGWVGLVVCGLALILTANRICLLLLALLAVAWLFWPPARAGMRTSQTRGLVGAGAVLLAVGVAIVLIGGGSSAGHQADSGIDHGRIELWGDSLGAVGERPLLGHGPGSYLEATRADQDNPVRFAHDMVVEEAVELGLPGAVLMLIVIAGSLAECWRRRLDPEAWLYLPLVAGFALMALTDWSWHLAAVGAIWALALGGLLARPVRPARS